MEDKEMTDFKGDYEQLKQSYEELLRDNEELQAELNVYKLIYGDLDRGDDDWIGDLGIPIQFDEEDAGSSVEAESSKQNGLVHVSTKESKGAEIVRIGHAVDINTLDDNLADVDVVAYPEKRGGGSFRLIAKMKALFLK